MICKKHSSTFVLIPVGLLQAFGILLLVALIFGAQNSAAQDRGAQDPLGKIQDDGEIEIDFMNAVYTDLDSGIQPVKRGTLTIYISSPRHQLTVHGNRLRLTDNGDGTVNATLSVDFEGDGDLVAELESHGMRNQFDDRVIAPRQIVTVSGTARLEHDDAGGYLMTVVEAPPSVGLEIRSNMAGDLVGLCKLFEKIPLIAVDCTGIESALSVVTAPLPGPGEQFAVPAERLTDDEKAYFDRFASSPGKQIDGTLEN